MSTSTESPPPAIETLLADRGIPYTRQRRAVWEFLLTATTAATTAEVADALRSQGVGQATVYRTVALLVDLGLLLRVQDRRGLVCYVAMPVGHRHPLICRECRKVVSFDGEGDLTYLEKHLEETTGFTIYGHHLEVYGICADCRRRGAADLEKR